MKLSKTAWLILGIGIFVIALGGLYMVYRQQGREREQLNDSLLVAQAALPVVTSEKEDWERQLTQLESQLTQLESELAQATSLLAESKTNFPKSVESIEYYEELFELVYKCNLEIVEFTSSEPSDKKVEDITYFATPFVANVSGEVADMLDFINAIVTGKNFTTATVELVAVSVPKPLSEVEKKKLTQAQIEEADAPRVTIKLAIYGYRGE